MLEVGRAAAAAAIEERILWIIRSSVKLRLMCERLFVVDLLFECVPAVLVECVTVETEEDHDLLKCVVVDALRDVVEEEHEDSVHLGLFYLLFGVDFFQDVVRWILF